MHNNIINYTAVFQLWAGLCVLCFYTNLFEYLTKSDKRQSIIEKLKKFRQKVNGLITDSEQTNYEFQIDSLLVSFKKVLVHLGKISFCFSLAIMFLVAVWKEESYNCFWLLIACSAFCLYTLILILGLPWKRRVEGWSFFAPALILCVLLLLGFKANFGYDLNIADDWQIVLILFSALATVPMFAVVRYGYDEYSFQRIGKKIDVISSAFDAYSNWKAMPNVISLDTMPSDICRLIKIHGPERSASFVDEYFNKSISNAMRKHNVVFAMVLSGKRAANEILGFIKSLKIELVGVLFAAFYLFIVIMCAVNL